MLAQSFQHTISVSSLCLSLYRYDEGTQHLELAGQHQRASTILQELVDVSVSLRQFEDAAYHTYRQALAALKVCLLGPATCQ